MSRGNYQARSSKPVVAQLRQAITSRRTARPRTTHRTRSTTSRTSRTTFPPARVTTPDDCPCTLSLRLSTCSVFNLLKTTSSDFDYQAYVNDSWVRFRFYPCTFTRCRTSRCHAPLLPPSVDEADISRDHHFTDGYYCVPWAPDGGYYSNHASIPTFRPHLSC